MQIGFGEPLKLLKSISTAQLAGMLGGLFTITSVSTWYKSLKKPDLAPSGRLISSIWIVLYTLMGTSVNAGLEVLNTAEIIVLSPINIYAHP
jgi:tryptophan-rich sensory protein